MKTESNGSFENATQAATFNLWNTLQYFIQIMMKICKLRDSLIVVLALPAYQQAYTQKVSPNGNRL